MNDATLTFAYRLNKKLMVASSVAKLYLCILKPFSCIFKGCSVEEIKSILIAILKILEIYYIGSLNRR